MNEILTVLPKWVPAKRYMASTSHTVDSLKHKRNGHWIEGIHWRKAPDGVFYYNWRNIDDWVENGHKQVANGH